MLLQRRGPKVCHRNHHLANFTSSPYKLTQVDESVGEDDDDRHVSKHLRDDRSHGRRHPGWKDYRENIKFDPSVREESDDPAEIRKQVEFYFSDANVVRDKFLFNQIGGSKNHSIPISVIHNFKRMRRFQPLSAVIAALKESDVLEVVNDDEVKRKTPLPEKVGTHFEDVDLTIFENEAMSRSLYAKGFGKETASTQYDIESFFEPYGPIRAVRLRRNDQKSFKGSVFVEFEDEDTMNAFLELDPKPKWQDNELKIMSKKEYCEMKVEDIKEGRIQANSRGRDERYGNDRHRGRGRGGHRGNRGRDRESRRNGHGRYRDRDDRDDDDWKGRRDDFQRRGYRDRDDRRKKRSRSDDEDDEEEEKQEYHGNGIPKVKITEPLSKEDDAVKEKTKSDRPDEAQPSKKRDREEDGGKAGAEGDESVAKKVKPEVSAEA
jgi:lupus La protein